MHRPMVVSYRWIAFSIMLLLLNPDRLFHSRRPSQRIERMLRLLSITASDSLVVDGCTKWSLTERVEPSRQSSEIWNRDVEFQLVCQRLQESFGLPNLKVEDHADRESRLNRNVRVDALATG